MPRALLAVLACWCGATAAAQTVDEIVVRNAAARGGAERWRAVRTMRSTGRMEIGQGMQVPFRLELKRPTKMRLEFDFAGATAVQVFDGANGWKLMPFLGRSEAVPFSEDELKRTAGPLELDGPLLDYAAKGHALALVGREAVEGHDAFKLRLTPASGPERLIYVDASTYLELQARTPHRVRGKAVELDTFFRDYRPVQGLLVPHVVESRISGQAKSHKLTTDLVQLDLPLDDARFARPTLRAQNATAGRP